MSRQAAATTRVRITVGGKSIEATLADSEAARDFASPVDRQGDKASQERSQTHPTQTVMNQNQRRCGRVWRSS